ncbi:hypothetical protein MTP99_019572 [Tenebrio molitor]|nr:hypothetical protein MTP99_019572 [Tenebrio molitor]
MSWERIFPCLYVAVPWTPHASWGFLPLSPPKVASTSGDHILSNINNNQKRHKRVTILKISKNELVQKLGGKAPRKTGYTADRRNLRHGVFLGWLQVIFEPLARKKAFTRIRGLR